VYLSDVTPNALDKWRSQWSPKAVVKGDRMSQTTQSHFLSRIKGFFSYCANLDLIDRDPAKSLEYIPMKSKKTMPLTPEQFKHVLKVTAKTSHGKELVALFLLMRWSGLRINDALSLRKTDMCGNRLIMTTQKTTADMNRPLPDEVIKALKSLPSEGVRPGYYFWPTGSTKASLTSVWTKYILHLNDELALKDEHGKPMKFHSHCLRDTFAVELLLAGVSLEKVSQLLTHKSVRTTEAYYAPWVSARRVQLENEMKEAMRKMGASFAGD
jgi:site-specific recombinase XerD